MLVTMLAALLLAGPVLGAAPGVAAPGPLPWTASWGLPMAWGYGMATNTTVRQLATLSVGGDQLRVRLSNAFGVQPVFFAAASVALQAAGASLVPGSVRALSFGGSPGVTVSAGAVAYSDPVPMDVEAGQTLAISVYVPGLALASVHPCCAPRISSYYTANGGGDLVDDQGGFSFRGNVWGEWVDAVDVAGSPVSGVLVALGDSITDGFRSAALSWPEVLQERMKSLPSSGRLAVLDEGITANTLTTTTVSYARIGGGPPALARLQRDVLSQPGLSAVILAEGTNDLWFGAPASQVIAGMQEVIAVMHAAGVRVIGTTILPRAGSEKWTPPMEANRQLVNAWVRTSGAFDGVVDLARVTEDAYLGACQADALFPPFDSGDHLHPNPAGETAMADAVDTALLGIASTPTLPVVASVTSTVIPAGTVTPTVVTRTVTVGAASRTPGCDPGPDVIAAVSPPPSPLPSISPSPSPSPALAPSPRAVGPKAGGRALGRGLLLAGLLLLVAVVVVVGLSINPRPATNPGKKRPGPPPRSGSGPR